MQMETQPEMVVQKLEGFRDIPTRRYVKDEELSTPETKRYKMVDSVERVPAGNLVMFPRKGHSIVVDDASLARLRERLHDPSGMVETEDMGKFDMSAVMSAAKGRSLVTVIQEAPKEGTKK